MDLLDALATASPDELATWLSPIGLSTAMLARTEVAAQMLERLRSDGPIASAVTAAFPELSALAAPMPAQVEHDAGTTA